MSSCQLQRVNHITICFQLLMMKVSPLQHFFTEKDYRTVCFLKVESNVILNLEHEKKVRLIYKQLLTGKR